MSDFLSDLEAELVAGELAIVGMAPPGTRGVQLVSGDRVHDVPFAGGVFAGAVPPAFERSREVRYLR